jgi:phage host-nuclease inhibitor protein Gam
MTAPAFLQNVDQEELDDLATVLEGYPNAPPVADADLDAVASIALREMAREQAELERYEAAMRAETGRIEERYARLMVVHETRRVRAEEIVKECARRATFVGKAKSRKVGNGTYGKKLVPERVTITDKVQALAFAKTFCGPEAVKVKTEESVVHSVVAPVVIAGLRASGALPNGFEHVGEHEEFYAKPLAAEGED